MKGKLFFSCSKFLFPFSSYQFFKLVKACLMSDTISSFFSFCYWNKPSYDLKLNVTKNLATNIFRSYPAVRLSAKTLIVNILNLYIILYRYSLVSLFLYGHSLMSNIKQLTGLSLGHLYRQTNASPTPPPNSTKD